VSAFELTGDIETIKYIYTYFNFIKHCLQADGSFLNYVNEQKKFTEQNNEAISLIQTEGPFGPWVT
jgi:hypothetical protein